MAQRPLPVSPRALPKDLAAQAADLFGRDHVLRWCEDLLDGTASASAPQWPDIAWLGGTVGWADYWARAWGARGLLHLGPPLHEQVVLAHLDDPHWRVQEMCLKVMRRHGIDDPDGRVDALVEDPRERVRVQAWLTLGRAPDSGPGVR